MKESYHVCFTSHGEVMFRDEEDHGVFLNLLALRSFSHDSGVLADAEMSTHVHLGLLTSVPVEIAAALRMSYTKYANHKYGRKGRMGEKYTFVLKVDGYIHMMILLNYILRNGLHHAAAATAFGYPFCSARNLFTKDIGLYTEPSVPMSRAEISAYLPRHSEFPDHYRMNEKGIFVRDSFMELRMAEQYYASPRNYLYQMNRLTDESWSKEQEKDGTGSPLTIYDIEKADEHDIGQMLKNETGRNFNSSRMQDLDVCRLIDKDILPSYGVSSVYLLTDSQKKRIADQLMYEFRLPQHQIDRCLVVPR